jgi:hypothetical protein
LVGGPFIDGPLEMTAPGVALLGSGEKLEGAIIGDGCTPGCCFGGWPYGVCDFGFESSGRYGSHAKDGLDGFVFADAVADVPDVPDVADFDGC